MQPPRRERSGLASAGLLLAALVGLATPPVLLAMLIGNPLPSWPVDVAAAVEAVQAGLVPSAVWVDVFAVLAWLAWMVLVVVLAVEVAAVARQRPSSPATPAWMRGLAQLLVSAALTVSGPVGSTLSTGAGPAAVVAVTATELSAAGEVVAEPVSVPAGTRLVTVTEADSWAGFAGLVLGDETLGVQLRSLNVGRQVDGGVVDADTMFVDPGWTLLVPTVSGVKDAATMATPVQQSTRHDDVRTVRTEPPVVPGDEAGSARHHQPAAGDGETSPGVAEDKAWTVEQGDHMWGIAQQTLEEVYGREVTDEEIVPYWRSVIDANADNLLPPQDPDLIYPGQVLDVPPVGQGDGDVDTAPPPHATRTDETVPSRGPGSTARGEHKEASGGLSAGVPGPAHRGDVDGQTQPPPVPSRPGGPASADRAPHQAPIDPEQGGRHGSGAAEGRTVWGSPAGLGGAAAGASFAAAGIAALLRRRRRVAARQRPVGLRLPTPAPQAAEQLDRLTARAADPGMLETLAVLLETVSPADAPPLITTADAGTVRLLWDGTKVPESLPAPWQALSDGDAQAGWQARLGDQGAPASIGMPLLVTLGRTDAGLTVLANIGAMRQLTVTGEPEQVRMRLRAAVLEVATSNLAGIVEVAVAGDNVADLIDDVETVDTFDRLVEDVTVELEHDIVAADRTPRLLVAHNGAAAAALPVDPHGLTGQMVATDREAGWVWRVDAGQATLLLPDGAQLDLVLPDLDPQLVADELDRLDADPVPAGPDLVAAAGGHPAATGRGLPDPDATIVALADTDAAGHHGADGDEVVVSMPAAPTPAWCEVQLLGPVRAVADGQQVSLSPQSTQLLVCLATAPDGLTVAQLEDRIWAGRASASGSRRVRQALHRLRTQLGDGPDGQPLLPRRTDGTTARVRLSPQVGTDWDRATAHLQAARGATPAAAVGELTAALELIRGPVLDGFTVDWATRLEQEILAALQDAAVDAATILRNDDDLDRADWAVRQGLTLAVYEPLYIEWAEIEKARGRLDQVPRILKHLESTLAADIGDTWLPIGPTKATQLAFHDLVATATTIEVDH